MTLDEKLNEIKKELIAISPKKILRDGLNKKLGRSDKKYQKAIEENCRYILSRSNYKAMLAISRYEKRKEKNNETEAKYGFVEVI